MIIFDGTSLESIAPVQIEDIRVNPIELSPVTHSRAIAPGADLIRITHGTRTVAITFGLLIDNRMTRQAALMRISEWAKTDKEYRLELPNYPGMYLMAACTKKPEPSYRQWWESKLRLTFTCFDDPYWISKNENTVSCGTQFNVLGDAAPLMQIERMLTEEVTNQSYTLDGNTMTFSSIEAGKMVIDLNKQTAVIGNSSLMGAYTMNSNFLIPRTGVQTITGTGTIRYHERWQ